MAHLHTLLNACRAQFPAWLWMCPEDEYNAWIDANPKHWNLYTALLRGRSGIVAMGTERGLAVLAHPQNPNLLDYCPR
jgi:hypothetical protein